MTEGTTTTGTSSISRNIGGSKQRNHGGFMKIKGIGSIGTLALMILSALSLSLAGCGGGGNGLSSQVVSGVASVGATLSGQVSLKDASTTPKVKTTVIGSDGSYAIDVTDMKGPFIVEAAGSAGGTSYTLHSYADGPGTANVNPLSDAAVANAAGVDDPSQVFKNPDMAVLQKISSQLHISVATLLAKLQPLLMQYGAENQDPISGKYTANHTGLDGLFDHVKFTLANGTLTTTDVTTGAMIFSGTISDMANWNFPSNPGTLPTPPPAPVAPTNVTASGGTGQVTLSWTSVSNATSYNVYYATTSGVTTTSGTKIAGATNPYVQTGLSAASAQALATTTVMTPPPLPVPAVPTSVNASGGTRQVTVSWPAVSGATSYNLYWSTTSGVTTTNGTKIAGATSPAVQMGLPDSTTYYYIVTALNGSGESMPSVQVAAATLTSVPAPTVTAAPANVTAIGGANLVTVSWTAVSGATSYNIYWSKTSGVTTATGTKIVGAATPYSQTGLTAGTAYFYIVTAVNVSGESPASAQATATTNAPPVVVPAAPTVSAVGGTNQVTLSWSAVSGATSYNIY